MRRYTTSSLCRVLASALTVTWLAVGTPTFAADFEVWLVDQSNSVTPIPPPTPPDPAYGGKIYIYEGLDLEGEAASSAVPTIIDLAGDTAALCLAATGVNPIRPHMILFNSTHSHAVLAFVVSGHVVIFEAATRTPIKCIRMSPGAINPATGLPFRQAHAAFPAPDDSYILVANQNGKLLERIDTDVDDDNIPYENADDIALDGAATLDLVTSCTTPSGAACQDTTLRPDNAPICPIIDSTSTLGFITLRGGGLFVVDPTTDPISILAEYDNTTVHGNGCGGSEVADSMYINSGGGTATNLAEFDVYKFPLSGYSSSNPTNTPAPVVLFSDDVGDRDSHGMVATKHGRYLWVGDRVGNVAEVFEVQSGARVNTVNLLEGISDGPAFDPAPDLVDISPSGNRLFFSLRGPNPLSGDPHSSTGSTPGLGVVQLKQAGKTGFLKSIVEIHNIDAGGVERGDAHGIRVRLK